MSSGVFCSTLYFMQKTDRKGEELSEAFKRAYNALNTEQRAAVDAIEGPVMVIAGPGTGKTQILTLRIAKILLETQVQPENILALTFTESGASAMRERLALYAGTRAYRVKIATFHSFCQQLISTYPDAYTRIIGGRAATDLEKIDLIESILQSNSFRLLRPVGDPSYYVTPLLRILSSMKQENISPDGLASIIATQEHALAGIEKMHTKGAHKGKVRGEYQKKEKSIEKNKELLLVYRLYEALLQEQRLFDFDDMIVETIKALEENADMLLDLQEQYHYIHADEHQDVNGSQNRILELLCAYHDTPNIFVVGDEKQAIYRFQGASLENFLYFEDSFSHTKTVALTHNYRSGQTILDAAFSLIRAGEGPAAELRIPLQAQPEAEGEVVSAAFSHQIVEDAWVVDTIVRCINSGVKSEEIAVIVRTNREVEQFASLLRKKGIAVEATADGDILQHPLTTSVFNLIGAVVQVDSQKPLFTLLHGAHWEIKTDDLLKVLTTRNFSVSLWSLISDEVKLRTLGVAEPEKFTRIAQVLAEAQRRQMTQSPARVLEYLLQESGLLKMALVADPVEHGRVIRRLYDELEALSLQKQHATLKDVHDSLTSYFQYKLPLNAPYLATQAHAVQVMTAHKSKGLEFSHVFVPHVHDSNWGGAVRRTYFDVPLNRHIDAEIFDPYDDERRLLFVAMTRAKESLHLSYAHTNSDGKKLLVSRLLCEIASEHMKALATEEVESRFSPTASLSAVEVKAQVDPAFLQHMLKERGLSATALNNYLQSPWNYLYRNVLRIPEVQDLPLLFGTAVHEVMQKVTATHTKKGEMPSDSEIKHYLELALLKLPLSEEEYTQLHEKGLQSLLSYIPHMASSLPLNTVEEFSIHVAMPTGIPEFPELTLTGKLDRLDMDGEGRVIQVVDYKTGKPKTRNVIEGKTQTGNGEYKRQLTFYALLLSLYGDERYVCKTGVLTFIEPDNKGVIHEERFEITAEEIHELQQEIISVVKQIIGGEFLTSACDEKVCDYCAYVHMLQQR